MFRDKPPGIATTTEKELMVIIFIAASFFLFGFVFDDASGGEIQILTV